jgi:uncharacterized membrane protein YphA (DoxX/SURF4 family)
LRSYVVWPWTLGLACLAVGLITARRDIASARGLDKLVVLGPIFFAAPLAAFSAEHFTLASFIQKMVPVWMPGRLVIAYFVGIGLVLAAASIALQRLVWLSASLVAVMFVLFVTTMHIPNAVNLGTRNLWIVALRDLSFGGGAMVLAGVSGVGRRSDGSSWLAVVGRVIVAAACVIFGVVYLVYPMSALGLPLPKASPPWIPLRPLWGYLCGAIEIVAGGFMLINRRTRQAATWLGLVVTVIVLVIYVPVLFVAVEGNDKLEALNYIWDTLLFAGTVLLVARLMSNDER